MKFKIEMGLAGNAEDGATATKVMTKIEDVVESAVREINNQPGSTVIGRAKIIVDMEAVGYEPIITTLTPEIERETVRQTILDDIHRGGPIKRALQDVR